MKKLFSVIVPVYNVEQYLPTCLDSLLRQGLGEGEYEVILVNDGSPDGSRDICAEYASRHSVFTLVDQENQVVGAARNNGIDRATGEYVVFVDSDDYLADNGLAMVKKAIQGG